MWGHRVGLGNEMPCFQVPGAISSFSSPHWHVGGGSLMISSHHKRVILQANVSASAVDSSLGSCVSAYLIVNVFSVQAMVVISISLHVLLVFGADGHNDEHGFL